MEAEAVVEIVSDSKGRRALLIDGKVEAVFEPELWAIIRRAYRR